MITRLLYGFFHLLGNLVAMGLVYYIFLPQTLPFGDDREVASKLYRATLSSWPFDPRKVEAVMGPCIRNFDADETVWAAQWTRIHSSEMDLVEVTWTLRLENDTVGTLQLTRINRALFGWEWTKATFHEKFKWLPGNLKTQPKQDVTIYQWKRFPLIT